MTSKNRIAIGVAALVAGVLLACGPAARADELDQKTVFSIDQPVRIPGKVVLPAGTYVMKRPEPILQPNLVRIMDRTETKIYATVFGIPRQLMRPSDKPHLMIGESPIGTVEPLTAWIYPGKTLAFEFPEIQINQFQSSN